MSKITFIFASNFMFQLNRDHVIVKCVMINVTFIMLKKVYGNETTCFLFKMSDIRLQMLLIDSNNIFCYEVRENRKILFRTDLEQEARSFFKARVYSYLNQLTLCLT